MNKDNEGGRERGRGRERERERERERGGLRMVIRLLVCILPVGLNKAAPVHLHKRYDSSYERHC